MRAHGLLEVAGRVPQLLQDGVAHVLLPDDGAVGAVREAPLLRVHAALVARLVEIGLGHQDEALDGDQHLRQPTRVRF